MTGHEADKKAVYQIRPPRLSRSHRTFRPNPFSLGTSPTARAAGRSSMLGRGDVSIELTAPLPSTTPPAPLSIARRTRGVARHDPIPTPRVAVASPVAQPGPPRPIPTPPVAASSPAAQRGPARPIPTPPVARASPAARPDTTRPRRPSPSIAVASPVAQPGPARPIPTPRLAVASPAAAKPSEADAWGRPRAQAEGRARGTRVPPPTRGHQ
jgi:hypothetical protein